MFINYCLLLFRGHSQFPTFKTLEPGSDIITWQPPKAGEVIQYNISFGYTNLDNVYITNKIVVNGLENILKIDKASPGSLYHLNITAIDYNGMSGDVRCYQDKLQPQDPHFSDPQFEVFSKTVHVKLQWIDEFSSNVDMYRIQYKGNTVVAICTYEKTCDSVLLAMKFYTLGPRITVIKKVEPVSSSCTGTCIYINCAPYLIQTISVSIHSATNYFHLVVTRPYLVKLR